MKSKLLMMGVICAITFTANAQTKGTNTLGFGVTFNSNKNSSSQTRNESKSNSFSLGYGHFIKDNSKLILQVSYGESKILNDNANYSSNQNDYGGFIGYQKYFPIVKTFYVFAGTRAGYSYGSGDVKSLSTVPGYSSQSTNTVNNYSLNVSGGLAWFLSKRFALETDLLSAGANYYKTKQTNNNDNSENFSYTNKSFNLSNGGLFNNLGFKVYFLF